MSQSAPVRALGDRLLSWYAENKRDLPWRRTRDPYALIAAEMMLQQTGVERIAPKWEAFVRRFPTWEALASASLGEVIREWRGLGYNRRAVSLHRIARAVVERFGGRVPDDRRTLLELPGVGPYTANAILSFVHERDVPAIDVNLQRVIGRVVFGRGDAPMADVERAAREALPAGRSSDWNQALMDFASLQCTLRRPACRLCPLGDVCAYVAVPDDDPLAERAPGAASARGDPPVDGPPILYGRTAGPERQAARRAAERRAPYLASRRYLRGRVVEAARRLARGAVLRLPEVRQIIAESQAPDETDADSLLAGLVRDGLLARRDDGDGTGYTLP
jgi:A/G-specific adenine glycosylase